MTDETRETLEQMYAYAASRAEWHPSLMPVTDPGWDEDDLAECVEQAAHWGRRALALRDVLTPRTCSTCKHFVAWFKDGVTANGYPEKRGDCKHRSYLGRRNGQSPDDGCIRGWQAREGER